MMSASNAKGRNTPPPGNPLSLEDRVNRLETVVIISQEDSPNWEAIEDSRARLREEGYRVKVKKSIIGLENALKTDPAIIVLDSDANKTTFEDSVQYITRIHQEKKAAHGPIVLAGRKGPYSYTWSGYMGMSPIISGTQLAKANGDWEEAVNMALDIREQWATTMTRQKVGVIGYGHNESGVGEALVKTARYANEPFDVKVISRSHTNVIDNLTQEVFPRKSICDVTYTPKIENIIDNTDMAFVCIKSPKGERPEMTLRNWCWEENAAAIKNLAGQMKGYKGLIVMVTNLPEINSYIFREEAGLEISQVASLGNLDAMRVFYYANQADKGHAKDLIGLGRDEDIYDCFVFGSHDKPVPGISLMRSKGIKGGLIINAEGADKFEKYVSEKLLKELPHYLKNKGKTDSITGQAMLDVAKAPYDNRIVTLGFPYGGDKLSIPLQRPCHVYRQEDGKLRVKATSHSPTGSELDRVYDARLEIVQHLEKLGYKFNEKHVDNVNLVS